MKPAQWSKILGDLLVGDVAQYEEQRQFLKRALPYTPLTSRVDKLPADFRPYAKSFSYATQKYGPLKGAVNLVTPVEETQSLLSEFMSSYYKFIARRSRIESAASMASQEMASWDGGTAPVIDEELIILLNFELVLESYASVMGMASMLQRSSAGIILISPEPMDAYPAVYSARQNQYIDWERFETVEVINLLEIYEEVTSD